MSVTGTSHVCPRSQAVCAAALDRGSVRALQGPCTRLDRGSRRGGRRGVPRPRTAGGPSRRRAASARRREAARAPRAALAEREPRCLARAVDRRTVGRRSTGDVRADDAPLPLGGEKQRALLALLLLNANHVVSRERLIDALWGDDLPETAVQTLQVYVSRLRRLLPPGTLVTRPPGYMLEAAPETIDLQRFERLAANARNAHP